MLCTAKCTFFYAPQSLFVVSSFYESDTNIIVGGKNPKPNNIWVLKFKAFKKHLLYIETGNPK